jgi:hypothetical protein
MLGRFLIVLLSLATAFPAFGLEINGQLKKAQAEHLSADPTCNGTTKGRFFYDTDVNEIKYCDASNFVALSTGSTIATGVYASSSENYTVLDGDGYKTILVTTGASDRTPVLPTAADNTGREITFKKVDSGAGFVVIEGEGAETINDAANFTLNYQYDWVTVVSDGTEWWSIARSGETGWKTFTGGGTWTTNTTYTAEFKRDGDELDMRYHVVAAGAVGPGGGTQLRLNIPTGLTVNEGTVLDGPSVPPFLGQCFVYDSNTSVRIWGVTAYIDNDSTTVRVYLPQMDVNTTLNFNRANTSLLENGPSFTIASGDEVLCEVQGLPITQFAHWAK